MNAPHCCRLPLINNSQASFPFSWCCKRHKRPVGMSFLISRCCSRRLTQSWINCWPSVHKVSKKFPRDTPTGVCVIRTSVFTGRLNYVLISSCFLSALSSRCLDTRGCLRQLGPWIGFIDISNVIRSFTFSALSPSQSSKILHMIRAWPFSTPVSV